MATWPYGSPSASAAARAVCAAACHVVRGRWSQKWPNSTEAKCQETGRGPCRAAWLMRDSSVARSASSHTVASAVDGRPCGSSARSSGGSSGKSQVPAVARAACRYQIRSRSRAASRSAAVSSTSAHSCAYSRRRSWKRYRPAVAGSIRWAAASAPSRRRALDSGASMRAAATSPVNSAPGNRPSMRNSRCMPGDRTRYDTEKAVRKEELASPSGVSASSLFPRPSR